MRHSAFCAALIDKNMGWAPVIQPGRLSHRMYAETHRPDALWAHTHTLFHILWHCGRQGISTTHTHTERRQDQGQLPASIFIIFILPDLLLPSWRQWSQPSPCDASTLHTHLQTHMLLYTQQPLSTDNWDQLLQGASSLDPAPLPHSAAAAALAFLAESYSKAPLPLFPFSPPTHTLSLSHCHFPSVVLIDR